MRKFIFWFIILCCFATADVISQTKIKNDTLKTVTLTPRESRIIKNLVSADTAFIAGEINLQTEILKFNPNLIYKYRLDSIKSAVSLDYNPYVQTYIDIFLTKRKDEMGKMINLGQYYFPIFEQALAAYKIPQEFKYLPIIESSMNPMAVSRVGATGLWQFMYTTGKVYGLTIDNYVDERRDPIAASYAAAAYLRDAYNQFGDWLLALAAYNCGAGNVSRAMLKAGGSSNFWDIHPFLPNETRNYVPAFIAANYMMNYYHRYQDIKVDKDVVLHTDSVYVNKYVSFNKIAQALNMDAIELQNLNPSYKKNLINGSVSSPKRLIIPKVTSKYYADFFEALNTDENTAIKVVSVIDRPIINQQKAQKHLVKKGENLISIANSYDVEAQDLKVWNQLKSYQIVPGQILIVNKTALKEIPKKNIEPTYITYKVKTGDTLSEIAKKFENATIGSIKELNNLKSSLLSVGMFLKIYKNTVIN
ncbi:LysM peptidoglycan-binding domain-containing protein [Pedobacter cryophilus]|uniref:LysM peptidoglycan-binding domain-containing protein n=1 Tax=Pedobacter cryophilus TaxID=2571271 RepID=A0A4U1C6G1_9SPHI|nr:LysM peptidoglycan-binding domain-containing protein [Pedobacter cryophilus]TKC00999.1 LysM peptidoglycan-binding domain-containing protein [Pedobacter cryophilus]